MFKNSTCKSAFNLDSFNLKSFQAISATFSSGERLLTTVSTLVDLETVVLESSSSVEIASITTAASALRELFGFKRLIFCFNSVYNS